MFPFLKLKIAQTFFRQFPLGCQIIYFLTCLTLKKMYDYQCKYLSTPVLIGGPPLLPIFASLADQLAQLIFIQFFGQFFAFFMTNQQP